MAIQLPVASSKGHKINRTFIILVTLLTLLFIFKTSTPIKQPEICQWNAKRPVFTPNRNRINERSGLFKTVPILLQNITLIDGDGSIQLNQNLLIEHGTITQINSNVSTIEISDLNTKIVDLKGKFVSPGLVDMHSHFGTRPQPQLKGTEDTNEGTTPITPFVRSIDGIDSQDPDLESLVASGVTTHLVLTGSKNVISGESYAIKLHKSPNNLNEELLVQYDIDKSEKPQRWFKMAFGENEKQTGLQGYPVSRIGAIWRIRQAFKKAQLLLKKQDKWCSDSKNWKDLDSYPTEFEVETLVSILRGDLNLNIHLYEAYDFESLIRIANEFGFHINSFHHALSSYKVTELIKKHNSTVAIFSDEWGGKKEMYDGTVYAPKILEENNIPVAIKTDHPALPGQQLLYFAQIAHNYGLSKEASLASVMGTPANSIGLGHRIGYLREGYDADLVVWDRHPLLLGAHPIEVVIDGEDMFKFEKIDQINKENHEPLQRAQSSNHKCDKSIGKLNIIIKGIKSNLINETSEDSIVVIKEGKIDCIGNETCLISQHDGFETLEINNGFLLPGITSIAEGLGLTEMVLEPSTNDGDYEGLELISAADGIRLDGIMIERLSRLGITQGIATPSGTSFIKGYSTHFKLGKHIMDSIINDKVAIHFNVGHLAKSLRFPTISSQINYLRNFIISDKYEGLPIAIHTHNRAIMEQIIRLKNEFPTVKFIIVGAQEAHLIADEIAKSNIPLILSPWRCTAKFWENRHCSPNEPLERASVDILNESGVTFAIAYDEVTNLRRLFWEAGSVYEAINEYPGRHFSLKDTVDLISTKIEEIFGIDHNDNYLIFEGNPFKYGSRVALSIEDEVVSRCFPDVEESKHGDLLY